MDEERIVTLTLGYDQDCENPLDDDGMWKVYTGREVKERMTDRGGSRDYKWLPDSLDLFWKLRNGLAFTLDGWVDAGSSGTKLWINRPYDPTDRPVGLMVWEEPVENIGAKTYEERARDAEGTLDEFNRWCQGDCYWYALEGCGEDDSCGGFIGHDYFCETVKELLEGAKERIGPFVVVFEDDETEGISSHKMFPDGIEYRTAKEQREHEREYEKVAREEADELADADALDREVVTA